MSEVQKQEIDGVEYGVIKLSAFSALPVLTKITKLAGPAIVKMLLGTMSADEGKKKAILDGEVSSMFESMSGEFDSFFEKLDEHQIKDIAERVMKPDYFMANNVKVASIDMHFGNHDVFHFLKVLKFALKVNFSGFLKGNTGK